MIHHDPVYAHYSNQQILPIGRIQNFSEKIQKKFRKISEQIQPIEIASSENFHEHSFLDIRIDIYYIIDARMIMHIITVVTIVYLFFHSSFNIRIALY